jgi:hypothetical protein
MFNLANLSAAQARQECEKKLPWHKWNLSIGIFLEGIWKATEILRISDLRTERAVMA